jgi:hypothetical protein
MLRSAPEERVSKHEAAPSFETHRYAMLLRKAKHLKCGRYKARLPNSAAVLGDRACKVNIAACNRP